MKRATRRLPVRVWLTLWNAGILGVALLALGIAVRFTVQYYLLGSVDRELKERAIAFSRGMPRRMLPPPGEPMRSQGINFVAGTWGEPLPPNPFRFGDGPFGEGGRMWDGPRERPTSTKKDEKDDPYRPRFFDRDGNPVWGRDQQEDSLWDRPAFDAALAGEATISTVEYEGEHLRIYSLPTRRPNESINGVIQVPLRLTDIERGFAAVDRTLLTLLPIALLVTVSGGVLLTNRAIRPIEQALEQEKRFVADASHELRTPLAIIKTAAELGLEAGEDDDEGDPTPLLRRALERVSIATARTQRIVEDLMLLARAESVTAPPTGSKPPMLLTLEPVLARDFLSDAATLFDPIKAKREINVDVAANNLVIWVDRHHLGRVLSNLIDNAVRHTDPDTGTVTLSATSTGDQVVITVMDNGEGIPAVDIPNLFRRFYRPDASRVRSRGGSGLGLSIAKAVVEAHGGGIALESAEGVGTIVRLHLPPAKKA